MDYEKRYKEALKKARELSKTVTGTNYEYIFPELKEDNNDERMKREILELVSISGIDYNQYEEIKDWLEKQGFSKKQTNLPYFTFDDVLALQCCMETVKKVQEDKELYEKLNDLHSKVYDACQLEKQGEQKPTDKIEPKFKVGDKFVKKGTRDSSVMCIERINYRFGQEPIYDMKPFNHCGNRQTISEETLIELYNKIV